MPQERFQPVGQQIRLDMFQLFGDVMHLIPTKAQGIFYEKHFHSLCLRIVANAAFLPVRVNETPWYGR